MAGVTLSKEFGANPSVDHCFICNSELGVVLFGTAYKENGKTVKAPMNVCTGQICDECKKQIDNGYVFLIEVIKRDMNARTGRYIRMIQEALNVEAPKGIVLVLKEDFQSILENIEKEKVAV